MVFAYMQLACRGGEYMKMQLWSRLFFLMIITKGLTAYLHEHRAVEASNNATPKPGHLCAQTSKFYITNHTGHPVSSLKVTFKFVKPYKKKEVDHSLGVVEAGTIGNGQTVMVCSQAAIQAGEQQQINPSKEWDKVENVIILSLDSTLYPYHINKSGFRENHFVISRLDDEDVIETKEHYRKRTRSIKIDKHGNYVPYTESGHA